MRRPAIGIAVAALVLSALDLAHLIDIPRLIPALLFLAAIGLFLAGRTVGR